MDAQGREIIREYAGGTNNPPPPHGPVVSGGDGPLGLSFAARLRIVEVGLGALVAVFGLAFWFTMERIDTRFDRVDEPLHELQRNVAAQTEALKSVSERLNELRADAREGPKRGGE